MASSTWWTWVWVSSKNWWWTGRPGVLQSMGWQRVKHRWATELNWTDLIADDGSRLSPGGHVCICMHAAALALLRAIILVLGLCKLPGQFCSFAVSLLFGMVLQKLHVDFKSEPWPFHIELRSENSLHPSPKDHISNSCWTYVNEHGLLHCNWLTQLYFMFSHVNK